MIGPMFSRDKADIGTVINEAFINSRPQYMASAPNPTLCPL